MEKTFPNSRLINLIALNIRFCGPPSLRTCSIHLPASDAYLTEAFDTSKRAMQMQCRIERIEVAGRGEIPETENVCTDECKRSTLT